jgi:hypothetical protein
MSARALTACAILLVGCGGPPIGSHVPRANPAVVAAAAAATAGAITVANPDLAGKKPEDPSRERERRAAAIAPRESVPGDVLDRADGPDADEPLPPCTEAAAPQPERGRVELIPVPAPTAAGPATRCRAPGGDAAR